MSTTTTSEQQTTEQLTITVLPTTTTEATTSESTSTSTEQSTTLTTQIQTSGITQISTSDTEIPSSSSNTTATSDGLSQDEIILYSICGSLGFVIVVVLVVIVYCILRTRNQKDPASITKKKKNSPKYIVNDERVTDVSKYLQAPIPQNMNRSLATYQPKSLPEGWNIYNGGQRSNSQDKRHKAQNREKKQHNPQYESRKASRLYPNVHMDNTGYDNRAYYPNASVQQRYSPYRANYYHTHDRSYNWSYPALHRGYYVQDWLDTNDRSYEANWMY